MTASQRNMLLTALFLTWAIAVTHAHVRFADQSATIITGQAIGWALVPWLVSGIVAGAMAAWWKIRKQQGSAFAAMMWAIFLLVTAQSVVSFTVVANLPS
jgi:hypothetical protein